MLTLYQSLPSLPKPLVLYGSSLALDINGVLIIELTALRT